MAKNSKHHLIPRVKKQYGAALISALMIMALTATLSTMIAIEQRIDIHRTTLVFNTDRMYSYAQGDTYMLMNNLLMLVLNKLKKPKEFIEPVALNANTPTFIAGKLDEKFYHANIEWYLDDQQGLFNINILTNANNMQYFVRLLGIVAPGIKLEDATCIASNVYAWLTPSSGNMDQIYLEQKIPYRPAHRPMVSISELRLVRGLTKNCSMNATLFEQLKPYLTALPLEQGKPPTYRVNINTAPAAILKTLEANNTLMSDQQIENLMTFRKQLALKNLNTGTEQDASKQQTQLLEQIKKLDIHLDGSIGIINSVLDLQQPTYFLARAQIQLDQQTLTVYTLLKLFRNQQTQPQVSIVWQSQDTI